MPAFPLTVSGGASAATAAAALPLAAQSINLRPGRYETVAEMTLPNGTKTPIKNVECLTADDLKDVSKAFLEDLGGDCKMSNLKSDGKQMTFTATCKADTGTIAMTADMSQGRDVRHHDVGQTSR